jgi:hypothetical protein
MLVLHEKTILVRMLPSFLGTIPSFGSPITLGSLATENIAVLGFDSAFATTNSVPVTVSGANFTVSGDLVSPTVGSGLTFATGSAVTSGAELINAESDFASLLGQLGALSYTPITINSGVVNNISTPGNYSFTTGTLNPGTVINITGPGQYIFDSVNAVHWSGVTINAVGLSSDNVFWYVPTAQTQINNSSAFGDVVQAGGGNSLLEATAGGTGHLTGRFLSGGFFTSLTATQGSTQTVNSLAGLISVPEPATLGLLALGFGFAAFVRRMRRA